jgi:hypothetical protein
MKHREPQEILYVMISTPTHDLMCAVDLLHEYEESESVWHDEMRESEELYRGMSTECVDVDTVAASYDVYEVFALIFVRFYQARKSPSIEIGSSLITEDHFSRSFFEMLYDFFGLFMLDISYIGMFYRLYLDDFEIFVCARCILRNGFLKVFLTV